MTLLQIIVLAVVQGITEFLPISSSGHLILVPELTDWPDQGLMMDVGVHVGTLLAVLFYFRSDVARLLKTIFQVFTFNKDQDSDDRRLILMLIISTLPIVIIGGLASAFHLVELWRSLEIIGWTSIIFGLLLYYFDKYGKVNMKLHDIGIKHAVIIGISQIMAIIPGTSRSGVTMTAARALGYSRVEAAHFSMLLSIPTIIAAATLQIRDIAQSQSLTLGPDLFLGAVLSFIAALIAIAGLLRWLKRSSMTPFVIYRVLLGIVLLYFVYQ